VIREFADADAEGAAALLAEHTPWLWTAAGMRHRLAALPERAHRGSWVAESEGEIVGWGQAEFDWVAERDDIGTVWVSVAPAARGGGLGSELFERGAAQMVERGARELRTWSFPEGDSFVEQRGFRRARVERLSAVDPRTVDTSALDDVPDGVALVTLGSLLDRLPEVHALFAEASADMPADHAESNLPYDEWLRETIGNPELSRDGSAVVLADDRPAALSWVAVDELHGFAQQELTGTARSHRRRGLARIAKLAVLRWCAERDIARVSTGNDSTNVGMLTLNDQLGFRPFAIETEWVKEVA
jgi:GNAT superfamily N-acetyltransferase